MRIAAAALTLAIAACGGSATSGPAWPKLHEAEHDGGESLAPHARVETAAALEQDQPPPAAPAEISLVPVIPPPAPATGTPATVVPSDETPMQIEDTVIEVNDEP